MDPPPEVAAASPGPAKKSKEVRCSACDRDRAVPAASIHNKTAKLVCWASWVTLLVLGPTLRARVNPGESSQKAWLRSVSNSPDRVGSRSRSRW